MKNKKTTRKIFTALIAIACLTVLPAAVLAADLDVSADATSVTEGDTITITLTLSDSHIAVADGVFTYDPSLLSYVSSNGGASDGYINLVSMQSGGSSSLTAVIRFAAIGEGEAVIDFSIENIVDYDGNDLGTAQAGVSIKIASDGTDTEGTDGATPTPVDISLTGVAAQNVLGTDAQMYIWRSLRSLSLPSGFTDRQVTYNDEYVGGAGIPDSEDIILLYLSETDGSNAGYYIFDESKDVLFPYIKVTSISAYFTFIWPDEQTQVPAGFEEAMLEIGEKSVPAWLPPGSDGSVYLVYVRSASGEVGFYLYNVEDRSLQRYMAFADAEPETTPAPTTKPETTAEATQNDQQESKSEEGISLLALILIAVCTALAVATAVFAVLYFKSLAKLKREKKRGLRVKDANL